MSHKAFKFPAAVPGMAAVARACAVMSNELSLIFGRDVPEAIGASIDIARKRLSAGSGSQAHLDGESNHFARRS